MHRPGRRWLARLAVLAGFLFMASLTSLPGQWEVYGAPPLEVTPRGTAPLPPPPGATPTFTPTASPIPPPPQPTPASSELQVRLADTIAKPIPQSVQGALSAEQGGIIISGDGAVTLSVPPKFAETTSRWLYQSVALTSAQREAAEHAGLLRTNLAFAVSLDPPLALQAPFSVEVRYQEGQVAGIATETLKLYHFDKAAQRWRQLENCQLNGAERLVRCESRSVGTFLLASTPAANSAIPLPVGGLGAAGAVLLLAGAAVWLWRQR